MTFVMQPFEVQLLMMTSYPNITLTLTIKRVLNVGPEILTLFYSPQHAVKKCMLRALEQVQGFQIRIHPNPQLQNAKSKGLKNEIVDQINHVGLNKKLHLSLELVGAIGRSRTDAFDKKDSKSQLKWKFEFPSVEKPGSKSWKTCNKFKKWIVKNDCQTSHDLK